MVTIINENEYAETSESNRTTPVSLASSYGHNTHLPRQQQQPQNQYYHQQHLQQQYETQQLQQQRGAEKDEGEEAEEGKTPYELTQALKNLQSIHDEIAQCGLCFGPLNDAYVIDVPGCLHRFCRTCIDDSMQIINVGECPTCRMQIPSMMHVRKDPQFDAMAMGALNSMKLLLDSLGNSESNDRRDGPNSPNNEGPPTKPRNLDPVMVMDSNPKKGDNDSDWSTSIPKKMDYYNHGDARKVDFTTACSRGVARAEAETEAGVIASRQHVRPSKRARPSEETEMDLILGQGAAHGFESRDGIVLSSEESDDEDLPPIGQDGLVGNISASVSTHTSSSRTIHEEGKPPAHGNDIGNARNSNVNILHGLHTKSSDDISSDEEESDEDDGLMTYNNEAARFHKPLSSDEEESDDDC